MLATGSDGSEAFYGTGAYQAVQGMMGEEEIIKGD
jgi:hypothetical protein